MTKRYHGYTEEEVREGEAEGWIPDYVLIAYMNDEHDGSDD